MRRVRGAKLLLLGATVVVGAAACGADRRRDPEVESAATRETGRPEGDVRTVDTVVFGTDRRSLDDSMRTSFRRREPDRALLERLLDQYAGLDFMIDEVWRDSVEGKVKAHAWQHDRGEERHAARLQELLLHEYRERYEPVVGDRFRHAGDSIAALARTGRQIEAFYRMVAAVHRHTLAVLDSTESQLTRPAVRDEIAHLRRDLVEEVADLDRSIAEHLPDAARETPPMRGAAIPDTARDTNR
jgi:hypothetical protein